MEKETTGLYLSGHPMDAYRDTVRQLKAPAVASILEDFAQEGGPTRFSDGQRVTLAGVVTSSKTKTTKKIPSWPMSPGRTTPPPSSCCAFPGCGELGAYSAGKSGVVVKGKLSVRDEKAPQLLCDSAYPLSTAAGGLPPVPAPQPQAGKAVEGKALYLKFPSLDDPSVSHMKLVFEMFPGTTPVKLVMADTRKVFVGRILLHQALVAEAQETWERKMWW